jgi:hypothetical protein
MSNSSSFGFCVSRFLQRLGPLLQTLDFARLSFRAHTRRSNTSMIIIVSHFFKRTRVSVFLSDERMFFYGRLYNYAS